MTVRELMDALAKLDPELPVFHEVPGYEGSSDDEVETVDVRAVYVWGQKIQTAFLT